MNPLNLLKKNDPIISIDLGTARIKAVEATNSKELDIINTGYANLPKDVYFDGNILNKERLKQGIYEALEMNGMKSEDIILTINSSEIITREVDIPSVDYADIRNLINLQMDELLPVNPADYIVDYLILGEKEVDGATRIELLLIGILKSNVEEHLNLLKELDYNPISLDFQGNSIRKLFMKSNTIDGINLRNKTIAAIDLGYSKVKLSIMKNGDISITRVLDIGINQLYEELSELLNTPIEEIAEKLNNIYEDQEYLVEKSQEFKAIEEIINGHFNAIFNEIELILLYYRSRDSENDIDIITLQGGIANNKLIPKLFKDYFNIETHVLNKLDYIDDYIDLSQYGHAIGGLINISEV